MDQSKVEIVTKHTCLLGESPVWDDSENRIFWIDILKGEIHYYYPEFLKHKTFRLNQMVGAIALRQSGGLVAALKAEFAIVCPDKETIDVISKVETNLHGNRFNDGKCDPVGRFWAGSMSLSDISFAGSLYALEDDYSTSIKISGVTCSNGLVWSLDHKTFYFIDTPTQTVVAYDYEKATGNISKKRVVITIPISEGYPDGMTIDTEGMLWIAQWEGWKVCRWDPLTGKLLYSIQLPASRITSCTFGGDTLEDLYITSAKTGLSEKDLKKQPLAGSLFVIKKSGFKGTETFRFRG